MGRAILIWAAFVAVLGVPIAAAVASPLLAWRSPIYIAAGFAGVIALSLILIQPMLIGGHLPGLPANRERHFHIWIGGLLVTAVLIHVVGLWIASPPDVIDALLFVSPTPFSAWGVVAMWALFAIALMVALRKRLRLRPQTWRISHTSLALVIVVGTVVHAILIEGTMETVSKAVLCVLVLVVSLKVIASVWMQARRTRLRANRFQENGSQ